MPFVDSHIYVIFNSWTGGAIYRGLNSMFLSTFREIHYCFVAIGQEKRTKQTHYFQNTECDKLINETIKLSLQRLRV